jgi:hypothetical protein
MRALNFQIAFARILTNSGLRTELLGKKTTNLGDFGLDESQLNCLLQFDGNLIKEYSRMLSATRLNMVLNVLPFTKKLLPEDFIKKVADDYEMKEPPTEGAASPTIEEVKHFDNYMKNSPAIFNSMLPFLRDVSRYEINYFLLKNESFSAQTGHPDRKPLSENDNNFQALTLKLNEGVKVMHFDYDVVKIIADLKLDRLPGIEKKSVNLILQPLLPTIKVKNVSAAICSLLGFCDGSLTVANICRRFAEQMSRNGGSAEVLRKQTISILKELRELRILVTV